MKNLLTLLTASALVVSCGSGGGGSNDAGSQDIPQDEQEPTKIPSQTTPGKYIEPCNFSQGQLLVSDKCEDGLIEITPKGRVKITNVAGESDIQSYLFNTVIRQESNHRQFYKPVSGGRYAYDFGDPRLNSLAIIPLEMNYKEDGIGSQLGIQINQMDGKIPNYSFQLFNKNMEYRPFSRNVRQLKEVYCPVLQELYEVDNGFSSYRIYTSTDGQSTDVTCEIKNQASDHLRSFSVNFSCLQERDDFCYITGLALD